MLTGVAAWTWAPTRRLPTIKRDLCSPLMMCAPLASAPSASPLGLLPRARPLPAAAPSRRRMCVFIARQTKRETDEVWSGQKNQQQDSAAQSSAVQERRA